ncbi:MAG: Na+/H+ antiporter NhaC family protein [Calditrichota bacterium]
MRLSVFVTALYFVLLSCTNLTAQELNPPQILLNNVAVDIAFDRSEADSLILVTESATYRAEAAESGVVFRNVSVSSSGKHTLVLKQGATKIATAETRSIPAWIALLPPFIAIALAFLTRAVVPALFLAIWFGAWAANGMTFSGIFFGLLDSFQIYVLNSFIDADHAAIMLFTFMLGGMVGIISRNGGMHGIVNFVIRKANTPRKGQVSVWFLGLFIFFDDYANTLIVGNTSRMLCDKLKISREKLAFLVDSTSAPVATIAIITTWIGFQVGLISDAIENLDGLTESAYLLFINSIAYSFYPILAIFFVALIAFSGRDYGSMYHAEMKARSLGSSPADEQSIDVEETDFQVKPNVPQRSVNAVLPILTLIISVMATIYITGEGDSIQDILGSADSYKALMYGTMLSVVVAAGLSVAQGILGLNEVFNAWFGGVRFMLTGIVVLVLAWALADISNTLHTADYIVSLLGETVPMSLLPFLVFIIAAITAFGSGSSWGVMAILMPLVIPLAWAVLENNGGASPDNMHILYSTIACVLCGAVWADHCSPISDTTILTSMATGCDLMDHVRTQMPYAVTTGSIALFLGTLPAGFGMPWYILLLISLVLLLIIVRTYGKVVPES